MEIGELLDLRTRDEWRRWLSKHHADKKEIWLTYYKKASGIKGIDYDESVEEALAYGWIDGQNKSIDEQKYAGRFTPRKPTGNWAPSNIERVKHLIAEGRMAEPGIKTLPEDLRKLAVRSTNQKMKPKK